MNKKVEERFDKEVNEWDKVYTQKPKNSTALEIKIRMDLLFNIAKKLRKKKNLSIIEVGCGTGKNISRVAKLNKTWKCEGIDISSKMIEKSSKRNKKIKFEVMDISKTRKNKKYDLIFLMGVTPYIQNIQKTMENVSFMSKKGGLVAFTYTNKNSVILKIKNIFLCPARNKIILSIINIVRKKILGRKVILTKDMIILKSYKEKEINDLMEKNNFIKYYEKDILFSTSLLGKISLWEDKILRKIIKKGIVKFVVFKKKK